MRIQRTLPPAATPVRLSSIFSGFAGLIQGKKAEHRFKSELKTFYEVKYCGLVSSGKAALTVILKAMHELNPEKKEVVIPAYTCYSVPSAILKAGLKIKLCDINPETLDFDFDKLNQNLAAPTILAVVPTHLFGIPADVQRLKKVIGDKDVFILEDAAQAMGGQVRQGKLGALGDAGFFSLGRGKAFSTIEGGVILSNNTMLSEKIELQIEQLPEYRVIEIIKLILFSFILTIFTNPYFFWLPKSLPFLRLGETIFEPDFSIKRMSSFQAGLAENWRKQLIRLTNIRQNSAKNWKGYTKLLPSCMFENIKNSEMALLRFPLIISNTNALERILSKSEEQGLGIMKVYPDSIYNVTEIRDFFMTDKYNAATSVARHIVTLPVHYFITEKDQRKMEKILEAEIARMKM